jgi:hypothetical protein
MTSNNPHQDSVTALDEAARRAHAASLGRLSLRVQAQLAQRRRAALTRHSEPASRAWPMLAIGSAAVLTLAVGLFVLRGKGDTDAVQTPATVATAPTPVIDTAPQATTTTADPDTTQRATPAVTSTDPKIAVVDPVPVETVAAEEDALPAELLAAEFDTADEAMGFGAQEESPDFYLWLGSQDAQADLTESL